jgi:glycerate 2-kinase
MIFKNKNQIISNGKTEDCRKKREHALELLDIAIDAVDPYQVTASRFEGPCLFFDSERFNLSDFNHIYAVAFGKASVGMMRAVLDHCEIYKGIVITNDTTKQIQHPNIKTFHGGHPIPNQQSVYGTEAIEHLLSHVSENDLLLVLISGGGSALLCHPRVSLEHLQQTTSLLLKTEASIQEINTIRKHLSFVKGGQLIQKVPGMVMSLIISDIVGDPISFISSGPTVADETTYQDAKNILYKYKIWDLLPTSVQSIINQGINKKIPETPNLDHIDKRNLKNFIIANNTLSCSALF